MGGQIARSHVVACSTHIGNHHRVNQDAGGAWNWTRPDGTPTSLLVVADGVSAGRHSEAASQLTVEVVHERLEPLLQDPDHNLDALLDALIETVKEASHQVAQRPHHSVSSADATTVVAVACVGDEGAGVWCGDSRVYRIVDGSAERLTRDHSWAEGVVSHGIMAAEDAARDPRARMITRWLGPPDQDDPGVESFRFDLRSGDVALCCTDGLYMYFSPPISEESEMAAVLGRHGADLQAGVDELVEMALQRGGHDNITAAATLASSEGESGPDESAEVPVEDDPAAQTTVQFKVPPSVKRRRA
jgi:protein phosphatase